MKNFCRILTIFALLLAHAACNEDAERFENIKKLRAFGAAADPVSSSPSTATLPKIVTMTFFAALPKDQTATAEPFIDEASKFAIPLLLTIVPNSEAYEDHPAFRIYSVKATAPVPPTTAVIFPEGQNFARFRYGMKIVSADEEEKIVGNILIYPEGAPELSWTAPTLTINNPVGAASVHGKQDISLTIDSTNTENFRISWFVNDGKIKNRRGIKTEWEPENAGEYTMLATVRGLKSGAFQYKIVDFKVE